MTKTLGQGLRRSPRHPALNGRMNDGEYMASYRFSASVIKRSSGRSVTAAAAYRAACELTCDRYGDHHDYSRKQGVVHSESPPVLSEPQAQL